MFRTGCIVQTLWKKERMKEKFPHPELRTQLLEETWERERHTHTHLQVLLSLDDAFKTKQRDDNDDDMQVILWTLLTHVV